MRIQVSVPFLLLRERRTPLYVSLLQLSSSAVTACNPARPVLAIQYTSKSLYSCKRWSNGLLICGFFQQARFPLVQWQPDAERRAAAHMAVQFDAAVWARPQFSARSSGRDGSLFLRRVKRFKMRLTCSWGMPPRCPSRSQTSSLVSPVCSVSVPPVVMAWRHSHQVHQDLLQLRRVHERRGQVPRQPRLTSTPRFSIRRNKFSRASFSTTSFSECQLQLQRRGPDGPETIG